MKQYFFILLSAASLSILTSCGADPTKCECDAELTRLLHSALATGNTETTDLADKCDRLYGGVEGYMYENCPENK
jgi:hypothetical protein